MKEVNALERCIDICAKYKTVDMQTVHANPELLIERMKELSGYMVYLNQDRVFAHDAYNDKLNELIDSGMSVNQAQIKANKEVPELYKYRRLLEAIERVYETMRSHLSYIKTELNKLQ